MHHSSTFRNEFLERNRADTRNFGNSIMRNHIIISLFESNQTATLCSRKASFKEVFKSVDSFLFPMINAQGTWKSPAGNDFV